MQRSGVSAILSLYNSVHSIQVCQQVISLYNNERSTQMCQQLNKSQFVQQYLSSSFHGQRASILLPVVVTTGHLISFNDHCYVNSLMY